MNTAEKRVLREGESDAGEVLLSLVIASRNDRHQGNSVLRLETAINFAGTSISMAGRIDQVELVVCDWGSAQPLRENLNLTRHGRTVVRFVEVSEDMARDRQEDSVFPEVLALNTAIRRSRGRLIGRIDQDTLVTTEFVQSCFSQSGDSGWPPGFAFLRRRSLPYAVCRHEPSADFCRRLIARWGSWFLADGPHAVPWFDAPVGVVLMTRALWHEMSGYDERLLYWGWMETDLGFRVGLKYPLLDLSASGFAPLYHIEHVAWRLPSIPRRRNQRVVPIEATSGSPTWGLADLTLPLREAQQNSQTRPVARNESSWLWLLTWISLPGMWIMNGILRCYKWGRAMLGLPRYPTAGQERPFSRIRR